MLGVEYLNRFECYFLNTAADTVRFVQRRESSELPDDVRHVPRQHRGKGARRGDHARARPTRSTCTFPKTIAARPGEGHVAWDETFDTLKETGYDGWMVIEAFGLALPEMAAATKIWRRMYQSEEQLARDGLAFMKKHTGG